MRILHLGKFYPPDRGGIETATESITEYLWSRKIPCDVICFSTSSNTVEIRETGVIYRCKTLFKILSTPFSLRYLWIAIRNLRKYDYIHAHVPNPIVFLIIPFLKRSQKLIVHWHSDVINQKKAYLLYRPFEALLLKQANFIIVATEEYYRFSRPLKRFKEKIRYIPYSVKQPKIGQKQPKNSTEIVVLSVGRLVEYKGFEYLVRAGTLLPNHIKVKIIGDGPEREKLETIIRAQDIKNIEILGQVANLEQYFLNADIFCLPSISRAESFGISLIEAMSYRLPLITTDNRGSGMNFINKHGETGLIVEPFSKETLANAIILLANDNVTRQKYSHNAYMRFKHFFEYLKAHKLYDDIYT